jgi:hypothetical protein
VEMDFYSDNILDDKYVEDYLVYMSETDEFSNAVTKDLDFFRKFLKTKTIKFTNGIKLSVPLELYENNITLKPGEGVVIVEIRGEIDEKSN